MRAAQPLLKSSRNKMRAERLSISSRTFTQLSQPFVILKSSVKIWNTAYVDSILDLEVGIS